MAGRKHKVVIIGGGTAGITVAARLRRARRDLDVAIIEPSDRHFYQPIWTLVGAGVVPREISMRSEADYIPPAVEWIRDTVTEVDPEQQVVRTEQGSEVGYEWLVVAPGIRIDWAGIDGLPEALEDGSVSSNYAYDRVPHTWDLIRSFREGTAMFTFPNTPIKCGGAPQKIMWLAEHRFRMNGVRDKARIIFATPGERIFGVDKYRAVLEKLVVERNIETRFLHNLVAIRPKSREAVLRRVDNDEEVVIKYTMMHVTPPQGPPPFIARSGLGDEAGWVDVDMYTLQHRRYPNVFSLGDASSLPTARTGAAVRKEAPVVVQNMLSAMDGRPLEARYNGYTSCPLTTRIGRVVLAEFDYDSNPVETFPFNQAKERWSMWILKRYLLPYMYWHKMLRGTA